GLERSFERGRPVALHERRVHEDRRARVEPPDAPAAPGVRGAPRARGDGGRPAPREPARRARALAGIGIPVPVSDAGGRAPERRGSGPATGVTVRVIFWGRWRRSGSSSWAAGSRGSTWPARSAAPGRRATTGTPSS